MHPDKMHTASGEEKSAAHDRFVDINAAFAVLSDVSTRRK
jgi:DnaJ-class molecular chaperone